MQSPSSPTGEPDGAAARAPESASAPASLSPVQAEMVEVFAGAAVQLGLPRSLGQIYGVLFCSPRPLAFRDIVDLLGISTGSASQGLNILRELGAIQAVRVAADRREHFAPELSLRRLLSGVLRQRVEGPLKSGEVRLRAIEARLRRRATDEPEAEFLRQRVGSLRTWHRKAILLLPLLRTFLGAKEP